MLVVVVAHRRTYIQQRYFSLPTCYSSKNWQFPQENFSKITK